MKKSETGIWNKIYKKDYSIPIVEDYWDIIIDIFNKFKVKKILDLACGSGRHLFYLLEKGFDVYGIDVSEEAIKLANSLLKKDDLTTKLTVGSFFEKLPYNNKLFDAVICIRALNHGKIEEIRKAIKEIERILKSDGLLFITVRKRVQKTKRLPFNQIAPRTYIPLEGEEKGIPHYLFNKRIIRNEFKHFKICFLKTVYGPKSWEVYYHLLAKLLSN